MKTRSTEHCSLGLGPSWAALFVAGSLVGALLTLALLTLAIWMGGLYGRAA